MNGKETLTPKALLKVFAEGRPYACSSALDQLSRLPEADRKKFRQPIIEFIVSTEDNWLRAWGPSALAAVGGDESFDYLDSLLAKLNADAVQPTPKVEKEGDAASPDTDPFFEGTLDAQTAWVTAYEPFMLEESGEPAYDFMRFYTLRALFMMQQAAPTPEAREDRLKRLRVHTDTVQAHADWQDKLVLAGSWIIRALLDRGDREALRAVTAGLVPLPDDAYMYALPDFPPVRGIARALARISQDDDAYLEHRQKAIRALGEFTVGDESSRADQDEHYMAANTLGEIITGGYANEYLRNSAVKAMGDLRHANADRILYPALHDENAEVRVQAARALLRTYGRERCVQAVIAAAFEDKAIEDRLSNISGALRQVDSERKVTTDELSKLLGGEDRERARRAEFLLADLGGWAAMQRLSQRRLTLGALDDLLRTSEEAVNKRFEDTIKRARNNFLFAMIVNSLIVSFGVILMGISVWQLILDPEKLATWVAPGAAGLVGVILTLLFNGPRQNAREDLAALVNVNTIYLGYLRKLNQVDATFKHLFMEEPNFNIDMVNSTLEQIDDAINEALIDTQVHLLGHDAQPGASTPAAPAAAAPAAPAPAAPAPAAPTPAAPAAPAPAAPPAPPAPAAPGADNHEAIPPAEGMGAG